MPNKLPRVPLYSLKDHEFFKQVPLGKEWYVVDKDAIKGKVTCNSNHSKITRHFPRNKKVYKKGLHY